ncbi:MAG TPA: putative Ig domain-containing protein [Candidatus Nanoarchaeia archaeon]|nr:putative Ig domain-containing protein [Candidatus Nanoarchaeia archaeon]
MAQKTNTFKPRMPLFCLTSLLFFISAVGFSFAIPVPRGISGVVYSLDGLTQAPAGTNFYVNDLTNGQLITGTTGKGESGAYSVSLKGNDGDTILISAWNNYAVTNITLSLSGVMRNVNLFLNTSLPQLPPVINSEPATLAYEDEPYSYFVSAYDENSDSLEFMLSQAPNSMIMDSQSGEISWAPSNSDVGIHEIEITVTDSTFTANQTYNLEVINVNDAPQIISIPVLNATENFDYFYDVDAIDDDNPLLSYSLLQSPPGMSINPQTGLINWTPTSNQSGNHFVSVISSDGSLIDWQNFTVAVNNVNNLPFFVSVPVTQALEDSLYNYDSDAEDPDNDEIAYSLIQGLQEMQINGISGNISFIPSNSQTGIYNITVRASDNDGFSLQTYSLNVQNVNDAPIIISTPLTSVYHRDLYLYDVNAIDEENSSLFYSLIRSPSRMAINSQTGLIRWDPTQSQIGFHNVNVRVYDGNLSAYQNFTVRVLNKRASSSRTSQLQALITSGSLVNTFVFAQELGPEERQSLVSVQSPLKDSNLEITSLNKKPDGIEPLSNRVYQYLEIKNDGLEYGAFVNFTVSSQWLNSLGIGKDDIVLMRYDDAWQPLETISISEQQGFVKYSAFTPGFSYFAIAVKEGVFVKNLINPLVSGIEAPFRLMGVFYEFGDLNQVRRGTKYEIANLESSETYSGETGIGPHDGAYYVTIAGKQGDRISVRLEGIEKEFYSTLGDYNSFDFMSSLSKKELIPIGKSMIYPVIENLKFPIAVIAALSVTVAIYFIARKK